MKQEIEIGQKYGDLTVAKRQPDFVSSKGHHVPIWQCVCQKGHHIDYRPESVKAGKCPYCSCDRLLVGFNDLKTTHPDLAAQWDYEKNKPLIPENFTARSHQKIWWVCPKCHEAWKTEIYVRVKGHECPYCAGKKASSKNNLAVVAPEIAAEWDYEKNGDLHPEDVAPYSEKMVWWKCAKGHEWQAKVENRMTGRGCRICSAELKSSFPEQAVGFYVSRSAEIQSRFKVAGWEVDVYLPRFKIAIEYDGLAWHRTNKRLADRENRKNKALSSAGIDLFRIKETKEPKESTSNVLYFQVGKGEQVYSHLGQAITRLLEELTKKTGINFTTKVDIESDRIRILNNFISLTKKDNFAERNPEYLIFWDSTKNGSLKPEMFSRKSNQIVWWKCPKCGGEWKQTINAFSLSENKCPFCSGRKLLKGISDLATVSPKLATEWDYPKNKGLTPDSILAGTSKKVWWKCVKGHEWKQSPGVRLKGIGCPYCAGHINLIGPSKRQNEVWLAKLEKAKRFYLLNGNLEVRHDYVDEEGFKLGQWINQQRTHYAHGDLLADRIEKLNTIGMVWSMKRGPKSKNQ
jgi:hypothetical protein